MPTNSDDVTPARDVIRGGTHRVSHQRRPSWSDLPPAARARVELAARANKLAGPVTVTAVATLRCECERWMRAGVDHSCAVDDRRRTGAAID